MKQVTTLALATALILSGIDAAYAYVGNDPGVLATMNDFWLTTESVDPEAREAVLPTRSADSPGFGYFFWKLISTWLNPLGWWLP